MTKLCSYFPLPGLSRKYDIVALFLLFVVVYGFAVYVTFLFYEILFFFCSLFYVLLCVVLCLFFVSRCIRRVILMKWLLGWKRG